MTFILKREQRLARPLASVFDFFQRPENLATITPPWLRFLMLTPSPVTMRRDLELDYRIRPFGIRLRWTSRITEYDPPRRFVDEQIRGPYRRWRHVHEFIDEGATTVVRDEVTYELPFGPLGWLVDVIYVRWSLKAIFDYRERVIREMLG